MPISIPSLIDLKNKAAQLALLACTLLFGFGAFAQSQPAQVSITINILPPYSPYYSDYSDVSAGKVLLTIRNLSATQKQIKLTGELKGDNGVRITTKSTYVPLQPITLLPNETKQLNGTALRDVFDLNTLNVYGIDKVKLVQTSRLPEGNYDFCLQAVDLTTNQVISDNAPMGCTRFDIAYPNAPVLISPMAFEKKEATTIQSVNFNWINPGVVPPNTQYTIQVAEMPLVNSDPNQVLNATSFYMLNQRITSTSYIYGIGNVPLKVGKTYAWRVIAIDPTNKTGFMNDGKSNANVFVYGSTTQIQQSDPKFIANTALLNVVSPSCDISPNVYVGPSTPFKFKWLWKDQIQSLKFFGTLDSNLLENYTKVSMPTIVKSKSTALGKMNLGSNVENIKSYKIKIALQKGKGGKSLIEFVTDAPKQTLEYTLAQSIQLGLVVGNTYRLNVTALSDKNTELATAESCDWVLTAEPTVPKLVIRGKIIYTFDQTTYYPANNATFKLQIANGANEGISSYKYVYQNGTYYNQQQNIGYATTDAEGNYTATIDKLPSDTGARYVAIEMISPYYQKSKINLAINIPKAEMVMDKGVMNYKQSSVTLTDFKVKAFNYALTVNFTKLFDKLYNTNIKNYSGQNVNTNVNLSQDMVNEKATVEAGLLVGIYRKAKKSDIPKYEGDVDQKNPTFPTPIGYIRVAEGKTVIANGKTQAVFDKLLISFASDDEYYIKLNLPKSDPKKLLGDNLDDLEAPETRLAFYPKSLNPNVTKYNYEIDYKIVSKKPPTALVRGKIMEQWPSTPGVLHPYANKFFNINLVISSTIPDDYTELLKRDDCKYYPSKLQKQVTAADGSKSWQDFTDYGGGSKKVVASGRTDKDGNYEIAVLDYLEMKDYDVRVVQSSNVAIGLDCNQLKKQADANTAGLIKDKASQSQPFINPGDYTKGAMKQQVEDIQKATGYGLGGESTQSIIEVIDYATGNGASTGNGSGYFGGGNTGGYSGSGSGAYSGGPVGGDFHSTNSSLQSQYGSNVASDLAGSGAKNGANKVGSTAVKALQQLNMQHIVSYADDEEAAENLEPVDETVIVPGSISRFFYMEGVDGLYFYDLKPVNTINNDANQTISKFQVPPFGTVNLGISVIEVKEIRKLNLKIIVDKQSSNVALTGAKLVIFRTSKNFIQNFVPPIGEGSPVHPNKLLINSNYSTNSVKYTTVYDQNYSTAKKGATTGFNNSFEWVLEAPLDITLGTGNVGTFDVNDKRLWDHGDYMALVTPNPEGYGGRFDPFIFNLANSGTQEIHVDVSPSRVAGQVIDESSSQGIAGATIYIVLYPQGYTLDGPINKQSRAITADANGHFEITNGANELNWKDNAHVRVVAYAPGYENEKLNILSTAAVNNLPIINENGVNYNFPITKKPGANTKFIVYGEQPGSNSSNINKVINAYIKREDGTVFTSAEASSKGVPMLSGKAQKFYIIPEDVGYFGDTVTINGGEKNYQFVTLSRLKHRLNFKLVDENHNPLPINTAQISINGQSGQVKQNTKSIVEFEFENVAVNNYTVQFQGISKSGYIPKIINIANPESKLPKQYEIVMEKGATISGKVMLGAQYGKFAKVYVDYNSSDLAVGNKLKNDVSQFETHADQFGHYELAGLPIKDNQKVKIHATLAPSVDNPYTIKGEEKEVIITNQKGAADFVLSIFVGPVITNLYGFPIAVEKAESVSATKTKITAIVDLSKNYSKFSGLSSYKFRISDVIFDSANKNQPSGDVTLDAISQIKMTYQNKYNVMLSSIFGSLKISPSGNGGEVIGRVNLVDNSFNYPSTYINFTDEQTKKNIPFYLSLPAAAGFNFNKTIISAIYNAKTETDSYFLSNIIGAPLKFNFIGFNATADTKNSYIATDGKIHLDVNFYGDVPNATPSQVDVNIKDLVLDDNQIYPSKGNYPLVLNLQDWKLEVRDWTLDPIKGGIASQNSLIKTTVVDVKANTFNLRKDNFILTDFDVKQISLGSGLLNLNVLDTKNIHLVYDQSCGSDQLAHWRFSGIGVNNKAVATIPLKAVTGKFPETTLNVNYFQMISYNKENLICLSGAENGVKLYNNPLFTFYPQFIGSSTGSFTLGGQGVISVPRVNNLAMNLMFSNGASGLDMNPAGLNLNFEGKGNVQFQNDVSKIPTFAGGVTTLEGTVVEPGKINPIPCVFSFGQANPGKIELNKGFELNLDGVGPVNQNSVKLTLSDDKLLNGMKVVDKDWNVLQFSGELTDPKSKDMVTKKPTYTFTVLGDISASSKGLEMEKTTPLGDVKMTYDFATKRMMGTLHMKEVKFGEYFFTGDVEIGYGGSQGFLLMGAGQLNTGTLFLVGGDGFGVFNIGVLFANATLTPNSIQRVTQYSKAKENTCWLEDNKDNFQGFFIAGGYEIINEHKTFDLAVASVYLNALLGVEASIGANFNKKSYRLLVGVHGSVNAGMSAISGTSIKGDAKAHMTAAAEYGNSGFTVNGNGGLHVNYTVSQYVVFDTLTFSGSQDARVDFQYKKGGPTFVKFSLDPAPDQKCEQ